jgi:hypothetical protein
MLAQYNVDEDGKQSRIEHDIAFSEGSGWDDSEPTDIKWPIYTSTLGELIKTISFIWSFYFLNSK